ncbi:MAG: 50S ribosomal protein L6 [Parcubacteria group bacterium]|nr:50S ribosomal protein L6 [Parcubacteria group bacterium]
MSRIGKKIITLPEKVTVEAKDGWVVVSGPKGELRQAVKPGLKINHADGGVKVEPDASANTASRVLWGTVRSLIANMVKGVSEGYEKKLEIEGIGFKAQAQGDGLVLSLGFSHPVHYKAPVGISFKVEKNTISVMGVDKALVGKVAAEIRGLKKPEPYKGKGIHYQGEVVRRKAGKKAVSTG